MMKEAVYYEPLEKNKDKIDKIKIKCKLCPKECIIEDQKSGFCRTRVNKSGKLYTRIYSQVSSYGNDPIEKKPLYHFFPGKNIFSLGTIGCNQSCLFCQNWTISQIDSPTEEIPPQVAVKLTLNYHSIGIAYTYSEPLIWYEYVKDTAKLAKENNLKNVLVTNGIINKEPLLALLVYIDAVNMDIKSIEEEFYRKYCAGNLKTVLENALLCKENGIWLEITNLVIPTLNDGEDKIKKLVEWLSKNLGEAVPLHFSRYFPHYKMTLPPTKLETLIKAKQLAEAAGLKYVYLGNVWEKECSSASSTYCPSCKNLLIERIGYFIASYNLIKNTCKYCNTYIEGIFQ